MERAVQAGKVYENFRFRIKVLDEAVTGLAVIPLKLPSVLWSGHHVGGCEGTVERGGVLLCVTSSLPLFKSDIGSAESAAAPIRRPAQGATPDPD